MEIKINEELKIVVESNCYTVQSRQVSKNTNKEYWKAQTYHSNLESAIKTIAQELISKHQRTVSLQKFLEEYKNLVEKLTMSVNV